MSTWPFEELTAEQAWAFVHTGDMGDLSGVAQGELAGLSSWGGKSGAQAEELSRDVDIFKMTTHPRDFNAGHVRAALVEKLGIPDPTEQHRD